ncbi:hypothetical protein K3495_g8638 [Podosphaera aphanis]|nr:hypothetical protein K3495_g8638 [Podosphaera aphanis]
MRLHIIALLASVLGATLLNAAPATPDDAIELPAAAAAAVSHTDALAKRAHRARQPRKKLEGFKCILTLFPAEQLNQSKIRACELLDRNQRTWTWRSLKRYPKQFFPPPKLRLPWSESYYLFPLLRNGKIYQGFRSGSVGMHFMVLDDHCRFLTVVMNYKIKPPPIPGVGWCPITGCIRKKVETNLGCEPVYKKRGASSMVTETEEQR